MTAQEFYDQLQARTREELSSGRAMFFTEEEMDKAVDEALGALISALAHQAARLY